MLLQLTSSKTVNIILCAQKFASNQPNIQHVDKKILLAKLKQKPDEHLTSLGTSETNFVSCTSAHALLSQHLPNPHGPGLWLEEQTLQFPTVCIKCETTNIFLSS